MWFHQPKMSIIPLKAREKLDAYIQKKHSDVLCFLVAGRRIELRTS